MSLRPRQMPRFREWPCEHYSDGGPPCDPCLDRQHAAYEAEADLRYDQWRDSEFDPPDDIRGDDW